MQASWKPSNRFIKRELHDILYITLYYIIYYVVYFMLYILFCV